MVPSSSTALKHLIGVGGSNEQHEQIGINALDLDFQYPSKRSRASVITEFSARHIDRCCFVGSTQETPRGDAAVRTGGKKNISRRESTILKGVTCWRVLLHNN
jgi:hypothetical protein